VDALYSLAAQAQAQGELQGDNPIYRPNPLAGPIPTEAPRVFAHPLYQELGPDVGNAERKWTLKDALI